MRKIVSWDELLRVLAQLGYVQGKPGHNGGSAVPFKLPDGTVRSFHRPHNGAVLYAKTMARRLKISEKRFCELASS